MKRLFETRPFAAIRMATVPTPSLAAGSKDADDPRDRLLLAAGQAFAEHGYEAATVRDIFLEAGVNVAAVNYYFGDKRRLYIESVKHAHEQRVRQLPLPEWGAMLANSRTALLIAPHLALFPGLAILLLVFGLNLFQDGLQVVLDPKSRGRT